MKDKKSYLIPKQVKSFSLKDKEILKLLGIDLEEFVPASIQKDTLLCEVDFSVRATNIIRAILHGDKEESWSSITISKFVEKYSEKDLSKSRNCGTKTIEEINNALYFYGFELSKI